MILNLLSISTNLFDLPMAPAMLNDNLFGGNKKEAVPKKDDQNSIIVYTDMDSKDIMNKIQKYVSSNKNKDDVKIYEIDGKKDGEKKLKIEEREKPTEESKKEEGKKEEEEKKKSQNKKDEESSKKTDNIKKTIPLSVGKNEGVVLEISIRGTNGAIKNIREQVNNQSFDKIYKDIKEIITKKDDQIKKLSDEKCKDKIKEVKNKSKLIEKSALIFGNSKTEKKNSMDDIILKVQTITIAEQKRPIENITKTITQDILKTVTHLDKKTISLTISVNNKPVKTITIDDKKQEKKIEVDNKKVRENEQKKKDEQKKAEDKQKKEIENRRKEDKKKLEEQKKKDMEQKNKIESDNKKIVNPPEKNIVGEGTKTPTEIFTDTINGKTFVSGDLKIGKDKKRMKFLGYVQSLLL